MNTRWIRAAITILLAILGAVVYADEFPAALFDDTVEAPAAVTEQADGIGQDPQDAAVADPEVTEPKQPGEPTLPGDGDGISSTGGPPSSPTGENPDRAEMLLRLSAADRVSGIRMSVGEEAVKKIVDAMRNPNPDVDLEIDGNTIIARGSVADLRTFRSSLLTLGQTDDAREWPPGLEVHAYGWRAPGETAHVASEKAKFIHLEHASASNVADVLMKLYPTGGRIVAEPSTNTLILRATSEQLAEVLAVVDRLEVIAQEREVIAQERREDQSSGGRGANHTAQPSESAGRQQEPEVRVFLLRHALAEELSPTLRELYADNIKVTVNDRANSLLVIASPETLGRIENLVHQLDQPADTITAIRHNEAAMPHAAAEAEREYAAAERQAAALAAQADKTVRDVARLRKAVGQAFEWRQRRQRAELEMLRDRLKTIERDIDRRDRIREEIIDRRVEELLKPELRWDRGEPPAAPDVDGLGATGVPSPVDGIVTRVDKDNLDISLGSDDGLRVGQRLEIFRDDTNLGHAVVQRIAPDRAVAKVDNKTKQGTIKVGDRIATERSPAKSPLPDRGDGGVTLSGAIPPGDSEPSPQEAGRLGTSVASSADVAAAEALLFEAERLLDHTETMVEKGYRKQPDLEEARKQVEAVQAKLRNARRGYEAKTRLLQLDVESAELKVEAAQTALNEKPEPFRDAKAHTEQQFALRQAELELQRAQTLLNLHTGDLDESKGSEETPQLEAPEQNAGPSEADAEAAIWRSLGARVRAMSKVGMPGDRYNGGLIIRELRHDSPAAKAGLQQGDIIIGVGKWETLSAGKLLFALTSAEKPGGSEPERGAVKVLLLRKAEPRSTTVVLHASGDLRPHDDEDGTPNGDDTPKADLSSGRPATLRGADHVRE